jgi:copper chaperone
MMGSFTTSGTSKEKDPAMHRFHLPTMTCGGCLKAATRALQSLDVDARIEGDLATRTIVVRSSAPEADLIEALRQAGYPAESAAAAIG